MYNACGACCFNLGTGCAAGRPSQSGWDDLFCRKGLQWNAPDCQAPGAKLGGTADLRRAKSLSLPSTECLI